jgi:hypothetical protein
MAGPILKFSHTDNGNCRVYYKLGRSVRCFQEDRPGEFTYYTCSKDGEPDSEAKAPAIDVLPTDDSATAVAFRKWYDATFWQRHQVRS